MHHSTSLLLPSHAHRYTHSSTTTHCSRGQVEILNLVSPHTTVAGLRAVYEDRSAVHIVMELCAGGELFERIVSKGTFSEAEAARYFRQMVEMVRLGAAPRAAGPALPCCCLMCRLAPACAPAWLPAQLSYRARWAPAGGMPAGSGWCPTP